MLVDRAWYGPLGPLLLAGTLFATVAYVHHNLGGGSSSAIHNLASMEARVEHPDVTELCYELGQCDECVATTPRPFLSGFDVVAFRSLEAGKSAVMGSAELSAAFHGYSLWFSSEENLRTFQDASDTEKWKYLPAWGGFCAWGIAEEYEPDYSWSAEQLGPYADPNIWQIIDGAS